jgi:hypothetical protein
MYIKQEITRGPMVGRSWEGASCGGGPGVEPRRLPIHFIYETNDQIMSDRWRLQIGPCVLIPFASYKTCVAPGFINSQPINNCHIIIARSVRACHVRPYGLYGLYGQVQSTSKFFFLFSLTNRSRYLLHTASI